MLECKTRGEEIMNLCSSGHEEVCFESRKCRACELIAEKEGLEEEIRLAKIEIENLNNQL
jgi:hypothetical protein